MNTQLNGLNCIALCDESVYPLGQGKRIYQLLCRFARQLGLQKHFGHVRVALAAVRRGGQQFFLLERRCPISDYYGNPAIFRGDKEREPGNRPGPTSSLTRAQGKPWIFSYISHIRRLDLKEGFGHSHGCPRVPPVVNAIYPVGKVPWLRLLRICTAQKTGNRSGISMRTIYDRHKEPLLPSSKGSFNAFKQNSYL